MPLNYINSVGLRYEAEEVRRCLLNGKKELPMKSGTEFFHILFTNKEGLWDCCSLARAEGESLDAVGSLQTVGRDFR